MKKKLKRVTSLLMAFIMAASMCVTGLGTALIDAFAANQRKIDIWDIGGVAETDTSLYSNNIAAADWNTCATIGADGKFLLGDTTVGDFTINAVAGDRLFAAGSTKNYGTNAKATGEYPDGYVAEGGFYCNGTGGEAKRYVSVANVKAGDTIVVYATTHNSVESTMYFANTTATGVEVQSATLTGGFDKFTFEAKADGTYKMYSNASTGKVLFSRVMRIPAVAVSGTIENTVGAAGYTMSFTNDTTGVEIEAVISGSTYTANLAPGYTYTASLKGATGFGFTNATKKVTTSMSEVITGKANTNLAIETKSVYTYSGKLEGFDASYDVSNIELKLIADKETLSEDVTVTLNANLEFTAQLDPDVEYSAELSGVNDYEITDGGMIVNNSDFSGNITVAKKAVYNVAAAFTGLSASASVTALKFVNVDDNYEYVATVNGSNYSVSLRNGSYAAVATVDGYTTSTHIVVNGAAVTKDLLFVSTDKTVKPVTWVADIYVGFSDKANNYETVNDAMKACEGMSITDESKRVTVHIAPGTYREQIFVTAPYVTLKAEGAGTVLLTWYYGIGYQYYSADSTGYYNPENAYDQFDKASASKWGCATYVKESATGFKAEGITFETSFNRYITDEEIEDGVEITGKESITFTRKYNADVTSKAATERATALAVEADKTEFYNCSFLGSQDTLYTGGKNYSAYYKNCFIEGNTDYIFGDGNVVFDGCELSFKGYSDKGYYGYITAAKDVATYGYLFRNCTVTGNDELQQAAGYFGRPWGKNAQVRFVNTKFENSSMITAVGWTDMSGNISTAAKFGEYNTVSLDGTAVDTSSRKGGVLSAADVAAIDVTNYFGSWTPANYKAEDATIAFTTNPYVLDNGDINVPTPGHTLTAAYSLGTANDSNDASIIKWYRVTDAEETLLKVSTANVDKTYKLTAADTGSKIKLVVAPETVSGNKGTEVSYTVEVAVKDGYEDPSNPSGDITLGDGINIFLAGDSTVKDYSANGMYMGGIGQDLGSWGEYIQNYFDSSVVTIQNYANGGRSSRNFINEGSLDKISNNIGEGDYLFIQFGHNDCSNANGYLEDRYVPLGTPDANGVYPVTAGTEVQTPASLTDKYGDTFYSYDCGGTYKWYLKQYIDAAKAKGAIPVLVTPVSRMYYDENGNIRPHHDSTDTITGTQVTTNNAYVTAVEQLATEEEVLLIDAFDLTKTMYEDAYKADPKAGNKESEVASVAMGAGEKTHSSKLGGFVSAGLIAEAIQGLDINISSAVVAPTKMAGETTKGEQTFVVNGKSELTVYTTDADGKYTVKSDYWTTYGQNIIDAIANTTTPDPGPGPEPDPDPTPTTPTTLWVIGDSTVCEFNDAYYYPRYGYGTQLNKYLDENVTIKNLALSGRSSKSYTQDPQYQELLDGMAEGDFLMIGFGHNDEKTEADRYTNPNGTYTDEGSFANSLYKNYIEKAQAKGVTVILVTPIVRRTATGNWSNSYLHITSDVVGFPGGDYPQAIRDLGTALDIPVVDMTAMTKNVYDTLGASETLYYHAWNSNKESSVDNTHTNIWGATYNAYMITNAIKTQNVAGLADHVKAGATAPTKAATLVSNPSYVAPDYSSDLAQSTLWDDFGIWKGSAFGNIGGNPSTANQTIGADANGNMHIAVANNKGKIAATVDGIAMYYYKVPVGKTFTLSATATINSFASNDQVSFGLMARDDMYIDTNIADPMGDYVAAGLLKLTQTGNVWNCFARKSGVLTQGGTCVNTYAAGSVVDLKIESNSDGYACTFGNETTITGGFDFQLTSIDSDYVYVGMYAARNADITFTDVKLIVDGEEVIKTEPTREELVEAFARRMYTEILGREAETDGLNAWKGWLLSGEHTGAEMANLFINGAEFLARNLSDEEFINVMYKAIMNRTSEADGMNVWKGCLATGVSRNFVLSQFMGSTEFTNICTDYGITAGSIELTEFRDKNYQVTSFVQRCNEKVFGRSGDVDGLNTWCEQIIKKTLTPQQVAGYFVFSDEAVAMDLSDADFVKMLYRTFMGRECESDESLNIWTGYLANNTRQGAFDLFASSQEFTAIVAGYGL